MLISRYNNKRASALTLTKRSNSSTALQKLAYHTTHVATLEPISDAPVPKSRSASNINEEPVDEFGSVTLMTVQQTTYKHHKDIKLPDLPPLQPMYNASQDAHIIKKIELCCTMCDFIDPKVDLAAKSIKASTLKELLNIFAAPTNIPQITNKLLDPFFNMLSANIMRDLPAVPKKYLFTDDEPIIIDIAWQHLTHVYQLLLKFQILKPTDSHFNEKFHMNMITRLHAPDPNERDCLVKFFSVYINAFKDREAAILTEMSFLLVGYKERKYDPFCVTPILKIFLERFKTQQQIEARYLKVFVNSVLPLISAQHLITISPIMNQIFDTFIRLDKSIAVTLVKRIIQCWPEAKPSKQILFCQTLNYVIERLAPQDFEILAKQIFQLYARCSSSSSSKIVEASFQIWSNVTIIPMILDNTRTIFPIVYPAFSKAMKDHWSNKTQNSALNTLKAMHDIDPFMFDELNQTQQKKGSAPPPVDPNAGSIHKNWASIARAAAKVDKDMNLARVLAEIQMKFNAPSPQEQQSRKPASNNNFRSSNPTIVSPLVRR